MKIFHLLSVVVAAVLASCSSSQESSPPPVRTCATPTMQAGEMTRIDTETVFTMMQEDKLLLLDCRPKLFHRLGHIGDALSFAPKNFDTQYALYKSQLDAAQNSSRIIVLYCLNVKCPDAYKVAKKLSALGYDVSIYKDGWEAWKRSGLANL